ncbi:MAG: long-chain fatty acid--CoA ligase [Deltaproteobacteria bacterium HGW-Deltaproteobacteria-14]|jgi:long-chain acyl-CoA synthetase|nr:MAG: long-chain fatty acid--CoA ligase [Deltaproteobacteria bacterium HGW-Deltaproteobacteria-14]
MDTFENLVDMFEKSTQKYAKNPLFGVKKGGVYRWQTYEDIAKAVAEFRGGLASIGVGHGDRVAVISDNRPEWAIGAYAVYGLGAQYVPMYEAQLEKDWKYILNDSGTKVLLVANSEIFEKTKKFVDEVESLEHVVNFEGKADDSTSYAALLKVGAAKPVPSVHPKQDDVCGFIYTSGTTGNPKGVLLSHKNLTSNVNALHEIFPLGSDDVSLSFLPWAHSFGQTVELHALLSYGASMGLAESVSKIIENLAEVRPTLLFSVPRIFNRIYDGVNKKMQEAGGLKLKLFNAMLDTAKKKKELEATGQSSVVVNLKHTVLDKLVASKVRERFGGRLKYAVSGGAALSKDVGEFIDNLGIMVYEGYGLTETSPIATANAPSGRIIGSVGRPIPGVRVVVIPAEGAPEGQGELVVYGPNVMVGYHNQPEANKAVFTDDGGFRTGDMGRIDDKGFVFITGRVKEQYKLENGKYVVPAPLEEKLRLSPFIANVMIDGTNKPFNVALIVPDLESLRAWATSNGVAAASDEALVQDPKVVKLFTDEIAKHSATFKGYEAPRKFVLTAEDFSLENGMLTPSLKVKRRVVMERYGKQLEALYA